jgi:cyclic pyranopterin phosphate synthase
MKTKELSHFDERGAARMVDVSAKAVTVRTATATARVRMQSATLQRIQSGTSAKGDVLQVARLAGIMAAKQTAHLIPLCHAIPLASVDVAFSFETHDCLSISVTAKAEHKTGVEMEALTAVSIAALTVYDMCKAIDRGMTIESIQLVEKSGGATGNYQR